MSYHRAMSAPLQTTKTLRQPGLIVYLAGVATSALALWGVNVALAHDVNILGWYVNAIIPVGALCIGIASGAGYAIASWKLHVKLSKSFVLGMLTTGLVDYAAAQYLNWSSLLEQHHVSADVYPFLQFLRDQCETMTFSSSHSSGSSPTELGMFGYFFKALEIAGFAGGTMIPSAFLFAMPYCKRCQFYLKKQHVGYVSSPMTRKELFATPRKERKATLERIVGELTTHGHQLAQSLHALPLQETADAVQGLDTKAIKDAAANLAVTLKKCPSCDGHHLHLAVAYTTLDRKQGNNKVVDLDKTELVPVAPVAAPSATA